MKLPFLSSQEVIKTLMKAGFDYAPKRGKGSHTALFKIDEKGRRLLVIIPKRKDMPKGVFCQFCNRQIYQKMSLLNY